MATADTSLAKQSSTIEKFKSYANSKEVFEAFKRVLGSDQQAQMYIGSVMIAVYNKTELQECSPKSIMVSAMRAASLRLSVDPAMRQAHLIPFKGEATLVVDYHGLVQLMMNTNLYEVVNVAEVYEGETVKVHRITGYVDIEGEKASDKVAGWVAYFKTWQGNEKFLYMSNEQCDAHGQKYSKAYNSDRSGWQTDREKMRRKTVLRCLANQWGTYSPFATAILKDDDAVEGMAVDLPEDGEETRATLSPLSTGPNLESLGFGPRTQEAKQEDAQAFAAWLEGADLHELKLSLKRLQGEQLQAAKTKLAALPPDAEPLFRYNSNQVTMTVAQAWDEAPNKVAPVLHELFKAGELPENLSTAEAALIKRPA